MLPLIFSSGHSAIARLTYLLPAWVPCARDRSHGSMCSRPHRSLRGLAVSILAPAESNERGASCRALPALGSSGPSSYMQYGSSQLWRPASVPPDRISSRPVPVHPGHDSTLTADARSSWTGPRIKPSDTPWGDRALPSLRRGARNDRIEAE